MTCRICLEDEGELIQPCNCKGTAANVHPECLIKWLNISGTESCEICKYKYVCEDVVVTKPCRDQCKEQCRCNMTRDDLNLRIVIYALGFSMMATILVYGFIYPGKVDTIFICMNVMQLFIIGLMTYFIRDNLNIIITLSYFKFCSTVGFGALAWLENYWNYFSYDACLLGFCLMIVYIQVLTTSRFVMQRQILL